MIKKLGILAFLIAVLIIPFAFKKDSPVLRERSDDTLVVITPHTEGVRFEFTQGFKKWYYEKTGRRVNVDWRVIGGTPEIMRFVNSSYTNAFQLYWTQHLNRNWSDQVSDTFNNSRVPQDDPVRKAFLESEVSCGMDILFGGNDLEASRLAQKGQLVDSGIRTLHPTWFGENSIPENFAGVTFWDRDMRWIAATHSGFGIIYNKDALKLVGYDATPKRWDDLADPAFVANVALADPMASSSTNRAFEMILQSKILELRRQGMSESDAIAQGWHNALSLIQLIASNARYFTAASTKPVLDVSAGDCAVGMSTDFYGLFQEENLVTRSNSDRFGFTAPYGGGVPTAEPIALFRGAPNREVALAFIEFVLSLDGQKLWAFKPGTPGGPQRYSLRRPPIRKELYADQYYDYRSNPDLNMYRDTGAFVYHPEWTMPLFSTLRFSIKSAFIDAHTELVRAREAIVTASNEGRKDAADKAMAVLQDLSKLDYSEVIETINPALNARDPLQVIQLQGRITDHFVKQYKNAEEIARGN